MNIKIIALVRNEPASRYFVNKIHNAHNLQTIIIENPSIAYTKLQKIRKYGVLKVINIIINKYLSFHKEDINYTDYFGKLWENFDNKINSVLVADINSDFVYDIISKEKPDIILDFGTSILRNRLLNIVKYAINLHWGLSPYYRGVNCTDWAILNWDPFNIGVTIHKLSSRIDGGEIIIQQRINIKPEDTIKKINMTLTKVGTDLIINIISRIKSHSEIKVFKQNLKIGQLKLHKHWSSKLSKHISEYEKNGKLKEMLLKPSTKIKYEIFDES